MTNGWIDIKNTDMMLIMGGNPAENHPCGFKWAIEAKRTRNAKMIVVDPRFTRTAATSDLFLQIRAGAGYCISRRGPSLRHREQPHRQRISRQLHQRRLHREGRLQAAGRRAVLGFRRRLADLRPVLLELRGRKRRRRRSACACRSCGRPGKVSGNHAGSGTAPLPLLPAKVAYDLTLQHPRCVFQLLRQQYSRYTPEMVERITGIPKDQFLKAADLFTSVRKDGDMKKVATIIYAVGWTQHTFGTQIIRTAAILQLLLGNVGRAGGGVNALRGHSNIQGATDMGGVFDNLPGYLKVPNPTDVDLAAYLKRITPTASKPAPWDSFNYWSNTPKFAVSFLKAMFGDAATKENDFAFHYLPKVDRNYSWTQIWDNMYRGSVKGMFAFGMNGVAIGPDSQKNIDALKKADWLVVGEIYPDETSEFWKSPGITPEEMKTINTTVYRLPCAGFAEKDGSMTNSARWLQWKNAAVPPPGDARLDQDIVAQIFLRVRELYQKEGGKFPDPILNLTWPYVNAQHPALGDLAKEINGKALADLTDPKTQVTIKRGQQLPGFAWLKDDGTTSCGNWIYSGSWTEAGNQLARRGTEDPSGQGIYQNWAWSWPANRRVLYNRASCDPSGKPWDPSRKQVWWSESAQLWVGNDVPDFKADSNPKDHMGPFIMNAEGVGRIFAPLGAFADGPSPSTTSRSRVRCKTRCIRTSRTIPWSRSSRRRRISTPRRATASTSSAPPTG